MSNVATQKRQAAWQPRHHPQQMVAVEDARPPGICSLHPLPGVIGSDLRSCRLPQAPEVTLLCPKGKGSSGVAQGLYGYEASHWPLVHMI